MEMALFVTESLIVGFAAEERVALLDEPILAAILSLYRALMQSLRLNPIVGEVLD